MKKVIWLFFNVILVGSLLAGCSHDTHSQNTQKFDFKAIQLKLTKHRSFSNDEDFTIQIKNTASKELTHLELYLSYPIKIENGTKENPFKMKGQAGTITVNIKKGQSAQFTFNAPIKEVFGNSDLLDFKNPDIKLIGYIKEGNQEVPFAMGGSLAGFVGK